MYYASGGREIHTGFWWESQKERGHWENLDVNGSWQNRMWWYGVDSSFPGYGPVAGYCEHDNEPSGSIKYWEIFKYLSDCCLLKKDSVPGSYLVMHMAVILCIMTTIIYLWSCNPIKMSRFVNHFSNELPSSRSNSTYAISMKKISELI
jgi:hypothetical protein